MQHATTRALYAAYTTACRQAHRKFIGTLPQLLKSCPQQYFDTVYPNGGVKAPVGCTAEAYEAQCKKVFQLQASPPEEIL